MQATATKEPQLQKNKGGRPRKYADGAKGQSYSLPQSLIERIRDEAAARGMNESNLVAEVLQSAFSKESRAA